MPFLPLVNFARITTTLAIQSVKLALRPLMSTDSSKEYTRIKLCKVIVKLKLTIKEI